MFKIGYKVICVDDTYSKLLKKEQTYTVTGVIDASKTKGKYITLRVLNEDKRYRFGSKRFILDLVGTRKEKLKNLCYKQEIK